MTADTVAEDHFTPHEDETEKAGDDRWSRRDEDDGPTRLLSCGEGSELTESLDDRRS